MTSGRNVRSDHRAGGTFGRGIHEPSLVIRWHRRRFNGESLPVNLTGEF